MCCNFHGFMKLASRGGIVRARDAAVVYNRRPMRRRVELNRKTNRAAAAAIACAIAMASAAVTESLAATTTANVTVQNTAVGVTPRYIGYNMGHYMPGSN